MPMLNENDRPDRKTHKKKVGFTRNRKKVMKLNSLTSQIRINLKKLQSWKQQHYQKQEFM